MKALIINTNIGYFDKMLYSCMIRTFDKVFNEYSIVETGNDALKAIINTSFDLLIMESAFSWKAGEEITEESGSRMVDFLGNIASVMPIFVYSINKKIDYVGIKNNNVKSYYTRHSTKDDPYALHYQIYPELESIITNHFYNGLKTREDNVKKLLDQINDEIYNIEQTIRFDASIISNPENYRKAKILLYWKEFINDENLFSQKTNIGNTNYVILTRYIKAMINVKDITENVLNIMDNENVISMSDSYRKMLFMFKLILIGQEKYQEDHSECED